MTVEYTDLLKNASQHDILKHRAFTPEVCILESCLGLKTKAKSRTKQECQIVYKMEYNCELMLHKYAIIFHM